MQALSNLRQSKRFWTAVVGLFSMVGLEFFPSLDAATAAQLQEYTLIVIGLLIGGYSAQDVAQAFRTGETKYDE